MKIVVASKNPVKTASVKQAFSNFFNAFNIVEMDVDSGVSCQPLSDEETLRGATNRARLAKENFPDADFWVGIEGGIQKQNSIFTAFAWVVICSENQTGKAKTCTFELPGKVTELIENGYELGHANDLVFKEKNSKQKSGAVGLLTKNKTDRTELYKQAVILALIPFINPGLY